MRKSPLVLAGGLFGLAGLVMLSTVWKSSSLSASLLSDPAAVLAKGTLISTPSGLIPVENLTIGMLVWSRDADGRRTALPIRKIFGARASLRRIDLEDGRSVLASATTQTDDGRAMETLHIGNTLDGTSVTGIEPQAQSNDAGYDLSLTENSAIYRANGIWLRTEKN